MTRCMMKIGLLLVWMVRMSAEDEWRLPPEKTVLRAGPGRELILGQCLACHSAEYITMQPPLNRAAWLASVDKMRSKYGAPVPTNTIPAIADYLVAQYGKKEESR